MIAAAVPILSTYFRLYRESFAGLPRATWLLALVTVINRAGTMVVPFLSLYFTKSLGFPEGDAGLLFGVWGIGAVCGALVGGWLADRFGSIRIQVVTLVLCGVGFFVLGQCRTFASLAVALFVIGAIFSAFRPANGATLAASCPPLKRGQAFAVHRLAINLGMAIGPVTGGFLAREDYALLFQVDGTVCVLSGVLMAVLFAGYGAEAGHEDHADATPGRSPWRDGVFLGVVLISLATASIMFSWFTIGPLYLRDHFGLDEHLIGLLLGLNPVLIVVFEMVLVHRLRGQPPLPWIAGGAALLGISCLLLPLGVSFVWGMFAVTVWTFGEMMESPLTGAFVANRAGAAHRGRYMGLLNIAFASAAILAPVVGTRVYQDYGGAALWNGASVVGLVAAVGAWLLSRKHRRERAAAARVAAE